MIQRHELEAWLGPALPELTDEQVDRLHTEAVRVYARYTDPDEQDLRDAAMSAAVQYLLGQTDLDEAGANLTKARLKLARVMAAAKQVAAMAAADGTPDAEAARRANIDRMMLLEVLGKRTRSRYRKP